MNIFEHAVKNVSAAFDLVSVMLGLDEATSQTLMAQASERVQSRSKESGQTGLRLQLATQYQCSVAEETLTLHVNRHATDMQHWALASKYSGNTALLVAPLADTLEGEINILTLLTLQGANRRAVEGALHTLGFSPEAIPA